MESVFKNALVAGGRRAGVLTVLGTGKGGRLIQHLERLSHPLLKGVIKRDEERIFYVKAASIANARQVLISYQLPAYNVRIEWCKARKLYRVTSFEPNF